MEAPNKRPKLNTKLSLDEFQARYTSEDNSSFADILDDENRKRKEKWAWAWDAQKRVEEQREKMLESRERMMIEAPPATGVKEKLVIGAAAPARLLTYGSEDEGSNEEHGIEGVDASVNAEDSDKGKQVIVASTRDLDSEVDVMAPLKDTRSAGVDGWKFKVDSATIMQYTLSCYSHRPEIHLCFLLMQTSLPTSLLSVRPTSRVIQRRSNMGTLVYQPPIPHPQFRRAILRLRVPQEVELKRP
jgi:protein DGCR14